MMLLTQLLVCLSSGLIALKSFPTHLSKSLIIFLQLHNLLCPLQFLLSLREVVFSVNLRQRRRWQCCFPSLYVRMYLCMYWYCLLVNKRSTLVSWVDEPADWSLQIWVLLLLRLTPVLCMGGLVRITVSVLLCDSPQSPPDRLQLISDCSVYLNTMTVNSMGLCVAQLSVCRMAVYACCQDWSTTLRHLRLWEKFSCWTQMHTLLCLGEKCRKLRLTWNLLLVHIIITMCAEV